MRWRTIDKSQAVQPKGVYSDWKPALAEEAKHQCVYCCISDAHFGGLRNFHVEHYRPKSKRKDLEHTYSNLFYACGICNTFKGDDWPDEPGKDDRFEYIHYPDPSLTNYSHLFSVDVMTAEVSGRNVTAKYLVEKLHLNRAQILRNRKLLILSDQLTGLMDELSEASKAVENLDHCKSLMEFMRQIAELFRDLLHAVPYESAEMR